METKMGLKKSLTDKYSKMTGAFSLLFLLLFFIIHNLRCFFLICATTVIAFMYVIFQAPETSSPTRNGSELPCRSQASVERIEFPQKYAGMNEQGK